MARLEAAKMRFLRSVKGYTRLDKITSEVIRNDGNASMPEQVKRPNPWKKFLMMMMMMMKFS
jgi:hypothetical protein